MSLGEIPQILKCATLIDKHKKQKYKDFPQRFEPEKNYFGFKMHLCFPSTWRISNLGNCFSWLKPRWRSLLFLYFMSTINMVRLDPWWKFLGSKAGGESLFFSFLFLSINVAHFEAQEIFPRFKSRRGIRFFFLFCISAINIAHLKPWGFFFGSKICRKSLFFCFWNL